jgi:hypothetical protein
MTDKPIIIQIKNGKITRLDSIDEKEPKKSFVDKIKPTKSGYRQL